MNRCKGLYLEEEDRVFEKLWREVCNNVQEAVSKTIAKRKNAKRQSGCMKRLYKELRKEE